MSPVRRGWAVFLVLVLLILATRMAVLWFTPVVYRGAEEQARGLLPLHLDQGLLMPFYRYQYDDYNGGGMVMGLVAYPFFHWLGPNYLSLKLAAVVFILALFTLVYWVAWRYGGLRMAALAGFFFLFSPPYFLERSLAAFGNHSEVAVFVVIGLWLFWQLQERPETPGQFRRYILLALLGLNSGLAMYFMYDYFTFLIVLVAMYLATVQRWRRLWREVLFFVAGFYVGLIPWMVYHGNWLVVDFFYRLLRQAPPEKVGSFNNLGLFIRAITVNLGRWFGARPFTWEGIPRVDGAVFNWIFGLVFYGSYFYLVYRHRAQLLELARAWRPIRRQPLAFKREYLMVPLLVYVPLHLVAYGLHKYQGQEPLPPPRYLMSLVPAYVLMAAAMVDAVWRGRRRWLAVVILLLIGLASMGGSKRYADGVHPGEALVRPGYSYQYFHEMLRNKVPFFWDFHPQWNFAEQEFPGYEVDYFAGAAIGVAFLHGRTITGHLAAAQQTGPQALAAFATGLGIAPRCTQNYPPERKAALRALAPAGYESFYAIGQGRTCLPPTPALPSDP